MKTVPPIHCDLGLFVEVPLFVGGIVAALWMSKKMAAK